jgi:hypothetical protein
VGKSQEGAVTISPDRSLSYRGHLLRWDSGQLQFSTGKDPYLKKRKWQIASFL